MRQDRKSGGLPRRPVLRIAVLVCFMTFAAPSALAEEYTYWWQMPKLTAGGQHDNLGSSVAIDGDYLVAGAPHDYYDDDVGAVHVFERDDSWQWTDCLLDPNGEPLDFFGAAVDTVWYECTGSYWIVVGSPNDNGSGSATSITTFSTVWFEHESDSFGDGFGWAVAVDDHYAVVGAPYDDIGGAGAAGAAYVYYRDG